jgi:epsilon-lactone hydrolase
MMVSPESEAIRTRVKQLMRSTLQLEAPLATRRVQYEAAMSRGHLPTRVQVEAVTVETLPAEWVSFPQAASDRVMLYLHGGGYTMGSCTSHRLLAAALAQVTGVRLLVLDYRLAPEHPFPAAVEDATAAYRWLVTTGIKPEHIVLAGDSCGGGLALATLISLRDSGEDLPAKAVLLSAWTDLSLSGASLLTQAEKDFMITRDYLIEEAQAYLGERDPRTPLASPLYADLHGFPPLLIQVGSDEILLDDATRVAERARQAGVAVTLHIAEGMWHVWHAAAGVRPFPEGKAAFDQIADFVRS